MNIPYNKVLVASPFIARWGLVAFFIMFLRSCEDKSAYNRKCCKTVPWKLLTSDLARNCCIFFSSLQVYRLSFVESQSPVIRKITKWKISKYFTITEIYHFTISITESALNLSFPSMISLKCALSFQADRRELGLRSGESASLSPV